MLRRNVELDARIRVLLAHGYTYRDIAKRLNVTVAAVRSRVEEARGPAETDTLFGRPPPRLLGCPRALWRDRAELMSR